MSIVRKIIAEYASAQESGLDCEAAFSCAVEAGKIAERTEIAKARQAALEEAAQIAERHFSDNTYAYSEIMPATFGREIADEIRAHASQQRHAVDLASLRSPNH